VGRRMNQAEPASSAQLRPGQARSPAAVAEHPTHTKQSEDQQPARHVHSLGAPVIGAPRGFARCWAAQLNRLRQGHGFEARDFLRHLDQAGLRSRRTRQGVTLLLRDCVDMTSVDLLEAYRR